MMVRKESLKHVSKFYGWTSEKLLKFESRRIPNASWDGSSQYRVLPEKTDNKIITTKLAKKNTCTDQAVT